MTSKWTESAEEYAQVKRQGVGPFGIIYSAKNMFLLEHREIRMNAFEAGCTHAESQTIERALGLLRSVEASRAYRIDGLETAENWADWLAKELKK